MLLKKTAQFWMALQIRRVAHQRWLVSQRSCDGWVRGRKGTPRNQGLCIEVIRIGGFEYDRGVAIGYCAEDLVRRGFR